MGDKISAEHTERKLLEIWRRGDPDYIAQQNIPRNLSTASGSAN